MKDKPMTWADFSARGGKANTPAQAAARKKNAAKARKARQAKSGRPRMNGSKKK